MRILLLGRKGQLGWELNRSLSTAGDLIALDFPDIDFNKPLSLRRIIQDLKPEVVVNAIAYTNVDQAEKDPVSANLVNADAPGVIGEEAGKIGAVLIHLSTDYVFNGEKRSPYIEEDTPDPINVYSSTKLAGEKVIMGTKGNPIILRTSWLFSLRGRNFALSVLDWARKNKVVIVPDDQTGSPTWARSLAEVIAQVIVRSGGNTDWLAERSGIYHLAGAGAVTRFDFTKAVLALDPLREQHIAEELRPGKLSDFVAPAKRPLYSALDNTLFNNTFHLYLPPWQENLRMMMDTQ